MKSIFLVLIIFLTPIFCSAQIDSIMKLVDFYEVDYERTYGHHLYIYNEDIYMCKKEAKHYINILNLTDNIDLKLHMPDSIPLYSPFAFCIDNESIFYYDWKYFHCFDLASRKHVFSTDHNGCGRNLKPLTSKIMIYGVGFCGTNDNRDQTTIDLIDLEKKNQQFLKFPNPSAPGFAFFQPSNVMDMDEEHVYVADYDNYRILIYDYDSNLLDSIVRHPKEWVKTDKEIPEYPLGSNQPVSFINKIRPYTAITSLIQNITLVGNNRLFVCWDIPNGDEFGYIMRYDIWEKINGKWKLKFANIKDFEESDNAIMDKYSIPIKYYYRVVGDYLLVKYKGATKELFEQYQGKTYKEFKDACDEYFLDNDLKSIIAVYKFK
jgi:hypothetical protein